MEVDAVTVSIVRTGSALAPVELQYYIIPNGDAKFYGGNGVLYFLPGDSMKQVTIIAKNDGIPQVSNVTTQCVLFIVAFTADYIGQKYELHV